MSDIKDEVRESLEKLRPHIDQLRVKAELLKMEVRDKSGPVLDDIEDAYGVAKEKLKEFGEASEDTAESARESLKSAWKTLKQKIHDATAPDDK